MGMLLLGFMIISFTRLFDIIAIAFLAFIIYSQVSQNAKVKRYSILAGLVFNVNPMELCSASDIDQSLLLSEVDEEVEIESSEALKDAYETGTKEIENLSDETIRSEMAKDSAEFLGNLESMQKEYDDEVSKFEVARDKLLEDMSTIKKALEVKQEELKNTIDTLGYTFDEGYVFNTEFKLGLDEDTMIYETVDVGMQNIVFKGGKDEKLTDLFIKVMLTNAYCNIRPGFLDVTVFDPDNMGRSLSGFYNVDLDQVFKITTDSLDKVIDEMKTIAQTNIKITKNLGINEYNRIAAVDGKVPLYYKILIILSQADSIEENETMKKFLEYSADLGIFVWILGDYDIPGTKSFNKPFDGVKKPISIDINTFPEEVMVRMQDKFKSLQSPALMWDDYHKESFNESSMWTYNADRFVELNVGYEDGDKTKNNVYTLGNEGDVHGIIVGGTGAGKSVLINNLIVNMCMKYSPQDLNLWLVDFKGTEFNFFLKRPDIGQEYMLPHIKACLCTSDPDYSVSLFAGFQKRVMEKSDMLKGLGYANMKDYNEAVRKQGKPELCVPREVIIVDEFQVIFERLKGKDLEAIKEYITYVAKLGRALGVHMILCSQSMVGTISKDILEQFTLRVALRCAESVSMAILNTKFASDIREKNGYLYVSSQLDKKLELQKRYRTPYIKNSTVRDNINVLAKRAEELCYKLAEPISYNENDIHQLEEIEKLYLNDLRDIDVDRRFILGERMVYSEKGKRANIILDRENNQNIFACFTVNTDSVMFFRTLVENMSYHDDYKIIFNTQVRDLGYLLGIDEYVDDDNKMFYDEEMTPSTLIPIFEDIVKARRESQDITKLKSLYIVLVGWDKAVGFGISPDYKLAERYQKLLQTCGVANIHFIMICENQNEIAKSFILTFKHRIAGKTDSKTSNTLLDSDAASKSYEQKSGYMFLWTNGTVERIKIYQSEITREIKARELAI